MQSPTPEELAKNGFFYAPLPQAADRVACYACGKVLFNWDEGDSIAAGHKSFSPQCPIVLGKPVIVPTGAMPKPVVKDANDTPAVAVKPKPLAKFVQSLRESDATVRAMDGSESAGELRQFSGSNDDTEAEGDAEKESEELALQIERQLSAKNTSGDGLAESKKTKTKTGKDKKSKVLFFSLDCCVSYWMAFFLMRLWPFADKERIGASVGWPPGSDDT